MINNKVNLYNLFCKSDNIFIRRMKSQLNEYYQCNDKGYVKIDNVKVDHLPIISEIPISARCNQILPYKLHKLEIMDPVEVSSVKFLPT